MTISQSTPDVPELSIPLDTLTFIVEKAREYDVKEGDSDPDSGSNPTDDETADILEDEPGDPTAQELRDAIRGLNVDQKNELVALALVGRGDYGVDEWRDALAAARDEHDGYPARYLMQLPLLGDYLEEGLAAFDKTIVDETEPLEGPPETDNT